MVTQSCFLGSKSGLFRVYVWSLCRIIMSLMRSCCRVFSTVSGFMVSLKWLIMSFFVGSSGASRM